MRASRSLDRHSNHEIGIGSATELARVEKFRAAAPPRSRFLWRFQCRWAVPRVQSHAPEDFICGDLADRWCCPPQPNVRSRLSAAANAFGAPPPTAPSAVSKSSSGALLTKVAQPEISQAKVARSRNRPARNRRGQNPPVQNPPNRNPPDRNLPIPCRATWRPRVRCSRHFVCCRPAVDRCWPSR